MVTVLAVTVKHAVEVDVPIIELLNDELVVLIGPVWVAWLEALDGGTCSIAVLLDVGW